MANKPKVVKKPEMTPELKAALKDIRDSQAKSKKRIEAMKKGHFGKMHYK